MGKWRKKRGEEGGERKVEGWKRSRRSLRVTGASALVRIKVLTFQRDYSGRVYKDSLHEIQAVKKTRKGAEGQSKTSLTARGAI